MGGAAAGGALGFRISIHTAAKFGKEKEQRIKERQVMAKPPNMALKRVQNLSVQ